MNLFEKTKELIKSECTRCQLKQKHVTKTKCKDCNFSYGSDCFTTGVSFSKLGLRVLRKHHFFYFLYHPELNFKFPDLPDVDKKGRLKENYEKWKWEIHHDDHDPTNDSKENLVLLLKTDHDTLHMVRRNLNSNPMWNEVSLHKYRKSAKERSHRLLKEGNHNFQKKE